MPRAHDSNVWDIDWHPLGHLLATGSNDYTCKFWTRNRPGDPMTDQYNKNTDPEKPRRGTNRGASTVSTVLWRLSPSPHFPRGIISVDHTLSVAPADSRQSVLPYGTRPSRDSRFSDSSHGVGGNYTGRCWDCTWR